MSKFSSIALLALLAPSSSLAFTVPSSASVQSARSSSTSSLFATVERTELKAPSDIPMDDVPGLFEKFVQKTYG